jgi:hypothetical protein
VVRENTINHTIEVVLGGVIVVYEFLNEGEKQRSHPVGANMSVMYTVEE